MGNSPAEEAFDRILDTLRQRRGLDFDEYRRTFLQRRIEARLGAFSLKDRDFIAYEKILSSKPDEWDKLFDTLTINVTEFFRDPEIWKYLTTEVLTPLLEKAARPIRIWSAGCASGEEPYSISILVHEAIRLISRKPEVQIMATDVDPLALERAKSGVYKTSAFGQVSPQRLKIFFKKVKEDSYEVMPEVKSIVKFYEHNYLTPAGPFSRIDLICCRNSMIYLNTEAKSKALTNFYQALLPGGTLALGATEVLLGDVQKFQFESVHAQPGVFKKLA